MGNSYVILKWNNKILSLLFQGNRLIRARAEEEEESILGNIYTGKVQNVTKNMDAVFVEIQKGVPCFLSLKDARNPVLLNRNYDGRLLMGDELLVQVDREAVKTKPPGLTTALALSGKYCVVSMGRPGIAWSSKLSKKVRVRMEEDLREAYDMAASGFGVVVRTNAKELTEITPLKEEMEELAGKLKSLIDTAPHRTCFSLLYRREPAYLTGIRDMYEGAYDEIVTDNHEIYEILRAYCEEHRNYAGVSPRLYLDELLPLHRLYGVEKKLMEALGRKVWLKSGGYLIIEHTEALTVIDVNSGKAVGKKEKEEAFFLINKEAAKEIAAQLMLRNISGMIVVDFINMEQEDKQKELMALFGDLLKQDSIRTTLVDITALGLVEITRMKTNKPLWEQLSSGRRERCGTGVVPMGGQEQERAEAGNEAD